MRQTFLRFLALFTGARAERELNREIEAHLALLQDDLERQGLSPDEARHAALRTYGGVEQARELHREARSFRWIENLVKDLRYGVRNLARTPGFTLVAILTLALGIGANTAIFSVVNAVLLQPLAYKDADRLVTLLHNGTGPVATANYFDWQEQSRAFEAVGAADFWTPNLTSNGPGDSAGAEQLYGLKVTQNLFPLLGVQPMLGRHFAPGEDQIGADRKVILSHKLWRRRFNSDRAMLGKPIMLNGEAYTVVGVMPPDFQFAPFWATRAELWVPNSLAAKRQERGGNHLRVFARLKPGVTLAQARADLATVTARLERTWPATNRNVRVTPLKENVVGKVETPLLTMLGAVGFVLLIACANVAHMLLARSADRQKEIALRVALGAGRGRVLVQFLTENLLLAALGAIGGLLLALAGTRALVQLSPAYLPRVEMVGIDGNVVLFLVGITLLTALTFGLIPAMRAAAANLSGALKEGSRGDTDGGGRSKLRNVLVVSEFALAFMLLIGAGLMVRSFIALRSVEPGFDPHNVLSMVVSVAGTKEAEPGQRAVFYPALMEKVRGLPGAVAAGGINHLPLAGDLWDRSFEVEGRPRPRTGESPRAIYRIAMPGYFETMKLPLRAGRLITQRDDARMPAVVVLNERAAHEYWPGESPIGKRITLNPDAESPRWYSVIGVVANAKQESWAAEPYAEMYLAGLQTPEFIGEAGDGIGPHMQYITLVVRTQGDPAGLSAAVKRTVQEFDRNLSISQVLTMDQAIADATAQSRFEMLLLALAGTVALILAAVGIYGVMNYSVARRTREIGIRMSLGASRTEVLGMVFRRSLQQAAAGTAVGLAGAILLSNFMEKMVFGVKPTDPATYVGVTILLAVAAVAASGIPARRASRIEPMRALRSE